MRQRFYLRLGLDKTKLKASIGEKPNSKSFEIGSYEKKRNIPTVQIALDIDINPRVFQINNHLFEIDIENLEQLEIKQVQQEGDNN